MRIALALSDAQPGELLETVDLGSKHYAALVTDLMQTIVGMGLVNKDTDAMLIVDLHVSKMVRAKFISAGDISGTQSDKSGIKPPPVPPAAG